MILQYILKIIYIHSDICYNAMLSKILSPKLITDSVA